MASISSELSESTTILLIQFDQVPASKTYVESDTVAQALDNILHLFEARLRIQNPQIQTSKIVYDYKDVVLFLDSLVSVVALVFDKSKLAFVPKDLDWIKQELFQLLCHSAY